MNLKINDSTFINDLEIHFRNAINFGKQIKNKIN
jgi:hypothetical protein